jgi:DNA polymerase III delta prime subunit
VFSFKDIIGQEAAKQRLIQEVQEGRIPHAQLFCGPAGVGKLPLALAYARYICCPNRTETDACGTCPSCVKWNKLVHPDVHFVYPIVKSAKGKKEVCDDYIANWRHLLQGFGYVGFFNLGNVEALRAAEDGGQYHFRSFGDEEEYRFLGWLFQQFQQLVGAYFMQLFG